MFAEWKVVLFNVNIIIHSGGGNNAYDVYLTGTEDTVSTLPSGPTTTTSAGAGDTTGPPVVVTQAGTTVVVTASSQTNGSQSKSSGPSIAGIAAGVVVGVGVLGIIIGSAFFFIRRRNRKAVEREYRRNAAISFAPSKTASTGSMNDSRWDGEYMAQRRQSNGSIAEDEDFSRRILKVCFIRVLIHLSC
jgi:cell wall integrity and stress response component